MPKTSEHDIYFPQMSAYGLHCEPAHLLCAVGIRWTAALHVGTWHGNIFPS